VEPGSRLRLADVDPEESEHYRRKKDVADGLRQQRELIADLQARLYAEKARSLLIVLQAMDTGGKDGTVKGVFQGVNPQGCQVWSFKAPSNEEADHDFLWRYHQKVPPRGMIHIFNRSHYEDVLIVRVKGLVPEETWRPRYHAINQFEHALTLAGVTVLKFMLHISKDEQKRRLESRLANPDKRWKFRLDDLKERALWDDYQRAFIARPARNPMAAAPIARPSGFSCASPAARLACRSTCTPPGVAWLTREAVSPTVSPAWVERWSTWSRNRPLACWAAPLAFSWATSAVCVTCSLTWSVTVDSPPGSVGYWVICRPPSRGVGSARSLPNPRPDPETSKVPQGADGGFRCRATGIPGCGRAPPGRGHPMAKVARTTRQGPGLTGRTVRRAARLGVLAAAVAVGRRTAGRRPPQGQDGRGTDAGPGPQGPGAAAGSEPPARHTTDPAAVADGGRGRRAERPEQIPPKGWKEIALRLKTEIKQDQVPLLSAGVAFYALLALFPAIIAAVSIYGLVADPDTVRGQIERLTQLLSPQTARDTTTGPERPLGERQAHAADHVAAAP